MAEKRRSDGYFGEAHIIFDNFGRMERHKIDFAFGTYYCQPDVVTVLSVFERLPDGCSLMVNLSFSCQFIPTDYLVLFVCAINNLKERGIDVSFTLATSKNSDCIAYAGRVDFFKILGIEYEEKFIRNNSDGKFTEVMSFDNFENIRTIESKVHLILHQLEKISKEVLQMLFWCLSEIMDNVITHSQKNQGWFSIQLFPQKREIRLVICDTGIGVHAALTSGDSEFKSLTEKEALSQCINKRVTNGKGLGFGLYGTSEFVKQNRGKLLIHSGAHFMDNAFDRFYTFQGTHWHGTYVFLLIKMDNAVDYTKIFENQHSLSDDYAEYIEKLVGNEEKLW